MARGRQYHDGRSTLWDLYAGFGQTDCQALYERIAKTCSLLSTLSVLLCNLARWVAGFLSFSPFKAAGIRHGRMSVVCVQMEKGKFYTSEKWKRKRAAILARDKYQCQICKRYGRMRQATEVHHIVHLEDDPSRAFDASNLISLCKACHNAQHPEKQKELRWRRYAEGPPRG